MIYQVNGAAARLWRTQPITTTIDFTSTALLIRGRINSTAARLGMRYLDNRRPGPPGLFTAISGVRIGIVLELLARFDGEDR